MSSSQSGTASGVSGANSHSMPEYGTLAVAGWGALALHLGIAGFIIYYVLAAESLGPGLRGSGYALTWAASGVCLLYMLLSVRRLDCLFTCISGPAQPLCADSNSVMRTVARYVAMPLLCAGGVLIFVPLFHGLNSATHPLRWDIDTLLLGGYLVLAGLSAEATALYMARAGYSGKALAPTGALPSGRRLFWAVIIATCMRLGGMFYYLHDLVFEYGLQKKAYGDAVLRAHLLRIMVVLVTGFALALLARRWGEAIGAWRHAAEKRGRLVNQKLYGGGHPVILTAFGILTLLICAVDAWDYGWRLASPMAAFLIQLYVVLPWIVLRLDVRNMRDAVERLAREQASGSASHPVLVCARLILLGMLFAVLGQCASDFLQVNQGISWPILWRMITERHLFVCLCIGSLAAEVVALEAALTRLAQQQAAEPTLPGR